MRLTFTIHHTWRMMEIMSSRFQLVTCLTPKSALEMQQKNLCEFDQSAIDNANSKKHNDNTSFNNRQTH